MDRAELVTIGRRVEAFMADEAIIAALVDVERTITTEWKGALDPRVREKCWAELQGLERVKRQLRVLVDRGKTAAKQIEQEK